MHNLSDEYISNYVDDNWNEVKHCVGGYKIENGGISILSKINGDYFSILGLPIIQLLNHLVNRGVLKH
jgi:septum formation protein